MSVSSRVRVHESTLLSDNWYVLRKTRFSYLLSNGAWHEQTRETYDRGNGAVILLYDPERRTIVLVRQFRFPTFVNGYDELLIEAPAGLLDDRHPAEAIRAEVAEETGFNIANARLVFEAFMSPGSVTEKLFFFVAAYAPGDRKTAGGGKQDEGEDIEVMEVTIDQALQMVARGEICDGKTSCSSNMPRCTSSGITHGRYRAASRVSKRTPVDPKPGGADQILNVGFDCLPEAEIQAGP